MTPPRRTPSRGIKAGKQDPIRILVVDDSAYNRHAITHILSSEPDVTVVGSAADGEEALKMVNQLEPDALTLDLEMPKMDGFTFLRVLMAQRPTPVLVISSYSRKPDVFKALELGALDFIAKPEDRTASLEAIRGELLVKLRTVRSLRLENLEERAARAEVSQVVPTPGTQLPLRLLVIGASTGGPPALGRILSRLPQDLPLAVAVAQHMPERFTRAFAERLNHLAAFSVAEAEDGEVLTPGRVLVAPGGRQLLLARDGDHQLRAVVREPGGEEALHCPSIDLLFESAARAMGDRVCAVVLTGMGNDGRRGIAAVRQAGGRTVAESADTAVVFGMPKSAIDSGAVDAVLSLDDIVEEVVAFCRGS
jgi:two-component system chemotaxis response regulator CheB